MRKKTQHQKHIFPSHTLQSGKTKEKTIEFRYITSLICTSSNQLIMRRNPARIRSVTMSI